MQEGAFNPGDAAIFEGVERARETVAVYYERKISELAAKEAANPHTSQEDVDAAIETQRLEQECRQLSSTSQTPVNESKRPPLPEGRTLFSSEPITDRKSVFVGHAIAIESPSEVALAVVGCATPPRK